MARSTRRTPLKTFVLFVCSLMLALAVIEAGLAVFYPRKVTTRQYHGMYHPVMGWINRPGVSGEVKVAPGVYFIRTHNGLGLRSLRETTYEKPPGTKRVLLLGDSFFWGFGVDDGDVVSERLRPMLPDDVEVINGAVTGYGTDQELLWLAEVGLRFSPDLVVLGFFPTNDMDEISHSIMYGYPKPYFSYEDGRIVVNNVPVPDTRETRRKAFAQPGTAFGRLKKFLRHNTHTYPFIVGRLNRIPALREFFLRYGLAEEYTPALPGVPNLSLQPEKSQSLSEALIREVRRVSNEAGAEFLLVFIPEKENTGGKPGYEGANDAAEGSNTYYSGYLEEFTSANAINYLDLLPRFRELQSQGRQLHTPQAYDHHWSPGGHLEAARAIHEWMERSGFTGARPDGPKPQERDTQKQAQSP